MPDLLYLNSDGDFLLLEGADGTRYRLLIDEGVRKAVRRETVSTADTSLVSPREIQLEIRSGITVEELAAKTGASVDYIAKFAAPVIDELTHVVSSALSVRITLAGDRYRDTTQVEFGEVVANRLAANGVVNYSWSARKSDNGGWQLQCRFGDTLATWAFDPRKLALAPENEVAVQLSAQQTLTDAPIPKLRTVSPLLSPDESPEDLDPLPVATPGAAKVESPVVNLAIPRFIQNTQEIEPVVESDEDDGHEDEIEFEPLKSVPTITADLGQTADFEGVVPFGRVNATPAPESEPTEDLANTADLLDALRQRRISREQELTRTTEIQVIAEEPVDSLFADESDAVEELDEEPAKPVKKPGRSSMPSWDQIVFSTKPEEGDAN